MKIKKLIMILSLGVFLLTGCSGALTTPNNDTYPKDEAPGNISVPQPPTKPSTTTPQTPEEIISTQATQVLTLIKNKDFDGLQPFIHPVNGLRLTPYTYVTVDEDLVFPATEINNEWLNSDKTYIFGAYDGSGEPIEVTPMQYYDQFIYSSDFLTAEQIGYNEVISAPSITENQFEIYEDSIIVEYYFSGFNPEYMGMDWQSLRLVFTEYDGEWYLTGIIHNQWTI